jgi:hypothetical protein
MLRNRTDYYHKAGNMSAMGGGGTPPTASNVSAIGECKRLKAQFIQINANTPLANSTLNNEIVAFLTRELST